MGDAPAERAPRADREVTDASTGGRQQFAERAGDVTPALEAPVAHHRPDLDAAPVDVDAVEPGNVAEVDERRWPGEAEVHHRHEALATRQDLGVLAELVQRRARLVQRAWCTYSNGAGFTPVQRSAREPASSTVNELLFSSAVVSRW